MGKEFLGRGWKFPVKVDPSTGKIMTSEYEEDVEEALKIILNTNKGERIMREDFGSNAFDYVFRSMDETNMNLLKIEVEQAILNWEPRVRDVEVTIDQDIDNSNKLLVQISYVVRKTNNLFNLVYPFYINEGTKIE